MGYNMIRFIGHVLGTAPESIGDKQEYRGLDDDAQDIRMRLELLKTVLAEAKKSTDADEADVLNVFMIPEFFFRGKRGAYPIERVESVIQGLQELVRAPEWEHWLFLFGTIVTYAQRTWPPGTNEAYNFCLVVRGGFGLAHSGASASRIVLKEYQSTIDFINQDGFANPSQENLTSESTRYLEAVGLRRSEEQLAEYDGKAIFNEAGVTFGVEICLDHAVGKGRLRQSEGAPKIDVQLVPSCGMGIKRHSIAVKKGFVFNCDGMGSGHSEVRRVGSWDEPQPRVVYLAHLEAPASSLFAEGPGALHTYGPFPRTW